MADKKFAARACEVRHASVELSVARSEAERRGMAPSAVLENARAAAEKRIEKHRRDGHTPTSEEDVERATLLRRVANDLRIAGCLQQSAEAFRRALLIEPRNARMIYEYARLLKAQASAFA